MRINDLAKSKIALETDPEKIISNYEIYSNQTITRSPGFPSQETKDSLAILKMLTISAIEWTQGEYQTAEEVFDELENYIKDKYPDAKLQDNNRKGREKRHSATL